ncbi:MAG: flippase [Chloroflexi bacterium]|nr:flippase [Chloroflexota bacterium]
MEKQLDPNLARLEHEPTFRHNMAAVAKGGGIVFTGKLFLDAIRFVTAFALARLLGADQYGMYSLALSALNIAVGLSLLGLDAALIRFIAVMIGRKDDEGVWGTIQVGMGIALSLSVVTGTVLFGFAYLAAERLFHNAALAPLLQLAAVFIPVLAMSEVLASSLKGFKRMDYPVIAQFVFQPVLRLILILILAFTGFDAVRAIITFGLADLGASLILISYLNREFRLKRPINTARRDFKGLLGFSLPVWMSGMMVQFQNNLQALVLGTLNTVTSVGIFSIASQITSVSGHFTSSINTSSKPIVAQLHDRKDLKQLGQLYQTANKWAVMVQLPIFLLMVIFPGALLSIFGDSYTQGATALIILAAADLLNVGTGMGGIIIDMTGYTKLKLVNSILRLVIYLGLDLLLIPRWGLVGAAVAVLAGEGAVNLLRLVEVYVLFKLLPFNRGFVKPVVAAVMAASGALLLRVWMSLGSDLLNAVLGGILLLLIYAGVTYILGFSQEEAFMLEGVRNRTRKFIAKFTART